MPACKLPKSGDAYHELYHGWALPPITLDAMPGLSPSDVPFGPKAATEVTFSACCRGLLAGLSGELGDTGAAVDAEAESAWVADAEVLLDAEWCLTRRCRYLTRPRQ